MDNIVDLARANMNQPTEPTPTENAQIMVLFDTAGTSVIYRFNVAKKGRKVYDALLKAWKQRGEYLHSVDSTKKPQYYDVEADMFDGCVDLDRVISISWVEWPKRGKFFPRML